MGADRAVRPAERLEALAGLLFVGENRVAEIDVHGHIPGVALFLPSTPDVSSA